MKAKESELKQVVLLFLKLGCIAFGGPAAHIAMMEDEVVKKRKWLDSGHFLDLIGATNLIPGPNSTEMTMHVGYERAGWKGLFVAGICFIFPAVTASMLLAWLYQEYGQLPEIKPFIFGIKPAVIAIILVALYRLGKKALKENWQYALLAFCLAMCAFGFSEILTLLSCGLVGLLVFLMKKKKDRLLSLNLLIGANYVVKWSSFKIFLTFFKVGAVLYGSGYVLFAFLETELVSTGLLTQFQLLDAIAIGQMTPGPVLSTASFIGWQLGGFQGALMATIGIFLPSFIFVLILNPLIPKLRKSKGISAFLDAVNVAAVGLIAWVCIEMGQHILTDWKASLISVLSFLALFKFKLNSGLLVLYSAILGYVLCQF